MDTVKIKKETKNKIKVDFERAPLWVRLKQKFFSFNFLKNVVFKIFRLILLVGITSCSRSQNEEVKDLLIGTWEMEFDMRPAADVVITATYVFNEDSTVVSTWSDREIPERNGTYEVLDGVIRFTFPEESYEEYYTFENGALRLFADEAHKIEYFKK